MSTSVPWLGCDFSHGRHSGVVLWPHARFVSETERTKFAIRGVSIWGVSDFLFVGEWPCCANAKRRSRDEALRMVVNVAGGVD